MAGARPFGVIGGTVDEPRVAFLKAEAVADAEAYVDRAPVEATRVFRFAAACEQTRCVHFDGSRCTLAQRIVAKLPSVVETLPPCLIRSTCRWYAEQGGAACLRCPQVVTLVPEGDDVHGVAFADSDAATSPSPPSAPGR